MRKVWLICFGFYPLAAIAQVTPTPHTCLSTVDYRIGDNVKDVGSRTSLAAMIPPGGKITATRVYLIEKPGLVQATPTYSCSVPKPGEKGIACPTMLYLRFGDISFHTNTKTIDNWDIETVTMVWGASNGQPANSSAYNLRLQVEYQTDNDTCSSAAQWGIGGKQHLDMGVVIPKDATFVGFRSYAKPVDAAAKWTNCDDNKLTPTGYLIGTQKGLCAPTRMELEKAMLVESDGMLGWQMICHTDGNDSRICRGELIYSPAKAVPASK